MPRHTTPPIRSPRRAAGSLLAILAVAALSACVTERVSPQRGVPVRPGAPAPAPSGGAPVPAAPLGPVARPAPPDATLSSRIAVGMRPLGTVEYDGFSLPIVSPDGRWLAVQQGTPPSWPVILGEPGEQIPPFTEIAVYQVTDAGLRRDPAAASLPMGLILGRASDNQRFLVEAPQPDGARWIGEVHWATGALRWLVTSTDAPPAPPAPAVASDAPIGGAHATLTPRGDLLYIAYPPDSTQGVLMCRTAAGELHRLSIPGASAAFPLASSDPNFAAVFLLHAGGTDIAGVFLDADRASGRVAGMRLGPRRRISTSTVSSGGAGLALAYQHAAPVQQPLLAPSATASTGANPADSRRVPLFFHGQSRMALFDPAEGTLVPLTPASIAAVPLTVPGQGGYVISGQSGVMAHPGRAETIRPERGIQVVRGAYLPRPTEVPGRYILFGPAQESAKNSAAAARRGGAAGGAAAGSDVSAGYEVLVIELLPPSDE